MVVRRRRIKRKLNADRLGGTPLLYAKILVALEAVVAAFALPLFMLGLFFAFAWLGVFVKAYPWAHIIALVVFTTWFFVALRDARERYHRPSSSVARRRLEAANQLQHRPLDVVDDKPVLSDPAQAPLWQEHVARNTAQLNTLQVPHWSLSFTKRDPFGLRYALVIVLAISIFSSWGIWGGRLMAAINPNLAQSLHAAPMMLNAWITPPEYTGQPPIMIATSAGMRHDNDVINVPEGSILSMHIEEKGDVPVLNVDGTKTEFTADNESNFTATATLTGGKTIAVNRGWHTLGAWNINVIADQPPTIHLTETPVPTQQKTLRVAYEASDDYGVQSITARVTPTMSVAHMDMSPLEVPISAPPAKNIKQVDYEDFTSNQWAGMPVQMQLVATDAAGHTSVSEAKNMTLPERVFLNPLARALIEERKKLLFQANEQTRDEIANMMAGVAHHPAAYHGDPLSLMALRSGAARLILDQDDETVSSVASLLWHVAVRLEDGTVGLAQNELRQAQHDLTAALDRNASEAEIQQLIDRMQAALSRYMQQLASRVAQQPPAARDLSAMMGEQSNALTPDDLHKMLENMRSLSATGSRDAARQQLAKLQQILENLRTEPTEMTEEQEKILRQMQALKAITKAQQQVLDNTFKANQDAKNASAAMKGLAKQQNDVQKLLHDLMKQSGASEQFDASADAMGNASGSLSKGAGEAALRQEGDALAQLQQAMQGMQKQMQAMMMPGQGGKPGHGRDPFGRATGQGDADDDGSVKIPDHMTAERAREILNELQRRAGDGARPKTEHDYIDRLLERF